MTLTLSVYAHLVDPINSHKVNRVTLIRAMLDNVGL